MRNLTAPNTVGSLALVAAVILSSDVDADVHSPWVVSQHVADTRSLQSFARFGAWRDKQGSERAIAIWRYLCDRETGVFHFAPIREGPDRRNGVLHIVRDPVIMLNSYGYGFCGAFGPTVAGIYEKTGFEKARAVSVPGCNHAVTEVWYDGAWHYFDVDLRGLLFSRDGRTVASVDDAVRFPELWTRPSKKLAPFFPADRDLSIYARTFAARPVDYLYSWATHAATMDYRLRKGETFTRWWRPQGGRWSFQEEDARNDWWKGLLRRAPYGAKSNHSDFSVWTHGNGLFDYHPSLRAGHGDYEDGVFDARNVALTDQGLTLRSPGEAEVVFEVQSPYVIVPKVGDLDTRDDDREASVVTLTSRGDLAVSLSLDFGRSWLPVRSIEANTPTHLDLTRYLRERYQYLIKFTLRGRPRETCLESLRIRTWVQVAPASLPRLKQGTNHLEYSTGDRHGWETIPWLQVPHMGDREEMRRYWSKPPRRFTPERFQRRLQGDLELEFAAPPGRVIRWATLGGYFATHQGSTARSTRNEIWYAAGDSGDWQRAYRADVPTWVEHWHYAADRDIVLKEPVKKLRVRYVGDPAVNAVRVNLHSERAKPRPRSPVVITHVFEMNRKRFAKVFRFDGPAPYKIECPSEPRNVSIAIGVPSDAPSRTGQVGAASEPPTPILGSRKEPRGDGQEPSWVEAMRTVHAKFRGDSGSFAHFGDSITDSRAFWSGLPYARRNASPKMQSAFELVNRYMKKRCWDQKGPEFGNQGGQTIRWAERHIDRWLKELNPEVALIMFGSNDLRRVSLEEYTSKTRTVVKKCLDNGTVVILSTIPPRHGRVDESARFAEAVRKIAEELHVPLIDYHAEILRRRPNDWDGAADSFRQYKGYDVPTLIARDGVHPSNPKRYRNDYSAEGLRNNGFALRNYLTLMMYAEVITRVLKKN